jgi:hypothetical protein
MRIPVKGEVKIWKDGRLIAHGKNLVVTTGKNYLAQRVGSSATAMGFMACGNNGNASSATTTSLLGTEWERPALTSVVVTANAIKYTATIGLTFGVLQTVREIGIFDAVVGGNMLCRFITSGFDISPGESALVEWTLTIG